MNTQRTAFILFCAVASPFLDTSSTLLMVTNSFIIHLTNKTFSPCLHSPVKIKTNLWEISRADQRKPETVEGFYLLVNVSENLPKFFLPGYEDMEKMFYFFYKISTFLLNKEKGDIRSAFA